MSMKDRWVVRKNDKNLVNVLFGQPLTEITLGFDRKQESDIAISLFSQ